MLFDFVSALTDDDTDLDVLSDTLADCVGDDDLDNVVDIVGGSVSLLSLSETEKVDDSDEERSEPDSVAARLTDEVTVLSLFEMENVPTLELAE